MPLPVGKAGRLVVPKAIRESLGLRDGTRLRLECSAGKLEVTPEPDEVQIQIRDGFPVITGVRPRKKGDIVKAIKAGRAERTERILAHRKRSEGGARLLGDRCRSRWRRSRPRGVSNTAALGEILDPRPRLVGELCHAHRRAASHPCSRRRSCVAAVQWVAPRLAVTALEAGDVLVAFEESSARGVRGGAIYDYLHLVAARKARAPMLYTVNISDFQSFHRPGDPKIVHP